MIIKIFRKLYNVISMPYFYFKNNFYIKRFKKEYKKNTLTEINEKFKRILIVAPHVDDDMLGCFNLIEKYKITSEIHILYLTNGNLGGKNKKSSSITQIRTNEAIEVAKFLNIPESNLKFLNIDDQKVNESNLSSIYENILNELNPELIMLPIFFDTHIDHFYANFHLRKVFSNNQQLFENIKIGQYEAQSPISPVFATHYISNQDYKKKHKVLSFYKSQKFSFKFNMVSNKLNGEFVSENFAEVYLLNDSSNFFKKYNDIMIKINNNNLVLKELEINSNPSNFIKSYNNTLKLKKNLK